MFCSIIPDDILKKLKDKKSLETSEQIRNIRAATVVLKKASKVPIPGDHDEVRVLYDAHNTEVLNQDVSNIIEVDYEQDHKNTDGSIELEMFDKTYDFFLQKLGMESYDNRDAIWKIFMHYGKQYNNAFWNGNAFVFGDADQVFFRTFWIQDVSTHEAMHAVTGYVTQLVYQGQSGALNEHISDVLGICCNHFLGNNSWVIGEGIWMPYISGKGLRTFTLEPAYDDPILGKDGQPKHMKDLYIGIKDNGGVHINSGILNHAFYSFVYRSGKKPFEEPLNIWWKAIQKTRAFDDFAAFAWNTIDVTEDSELKGHLLAAWSDVGIIPKKKKWTFWDTVRLFLLRYH